MNPIHHDHTRTAQDWICAQAGQLLKCDNVGFGDYFLDLGGDSLLAPVLANRIEARFGMRPALEDIFSLSMGELVDQVATMQPPSA
ncbi:hypothetical protein WH91_02940 [Devosia psychrophila]|uniref:Carrier domain-containing protein n=1 Tax=Devosia psychrophila TaxID=728005 RepID=A0ABR5E274_9HYPH|nr:phosphopantetheine-binding protein [Devosia psychrophila]KKC34425.1 hypothetical protein WH91_02940 [Devosia psychrophila]